MKNLLLFLASRPSGFWQAASNPFRSHAPRKNTLSEMDENAPAAGAGTEKRKLFVIDVSWRTDTPGPGLKFVNIDRLVRPGRYIVELPDGNPDQYAERPQLVHDPELGGAPRDFEYLEGIWIVSEALKQIFEAVDREAFAFAACDCTLADGSAARPYYLCSVVRELDALDKNTSRMKVRLERDHDTGEDVECYSIVGGASLDFRREVIGCAHIFRQPWLGVSAICDQLLFEAVTEAGVSGVEFRDVSDL